MDSGIASSQCDSILGSSQELTLPDSQTSDTTISNSQSSDASTALIATVTSADSQTSTKSVESQNSVASTVSITTVTSADSQMSMKTMESQRSDVSMMTVSSAASPSMSQPLEKDENDSGVASKDFESDLSDGWFNDGSTANNQVDEEGTALLALVKKQLANRPKGGQPIVETCQICMERPMDGCFPHPSFVHMCYCYKCASKVWKTNGHRCPICNVKVGKVLKVYKA